MAKRRKYKCRQVTIDKTVNWLKELAQREIVAYSELYDINKKFTISAGYFGEMIKLGYAKKLDTGKYKVLLSVDSIEPHIARKIIISTNKHNQKRMDKLKKKSEKKLSPTMLNFEIDKINSQSLKSQDKIANKIHKEIVFMESTLKDIIQQTKEKDKQIQLLIKSEESYREYYTVEIESLTDTVNGLLKQIESFKKAQTDTVNGLLKQIESFKNQNDLLAKALAKQIPTESTASIGDYAVYRQEQDIEDNPPCIEDTPSCIEDTPPSTELKQTKKVKISFLYGLLMYYKSLR